MREEPAYPFTLKELHHILNGPTDDDLIADIDWDLMEKLFPLPTPRPRVLIIGNPIRHDSYIWRFFNGMDS